LNLKNCSKKQHSKRKHEEENKTAYPNHIEKRGSAKPKISNGKDTPFGVLFESVLLI